MISTHLNSVVRVYVGLLLITYCFKDAETHRKLPRVCIKDGCLRGTWLRDSANNPYPAFLGIPFAKPPVGELRFKNPQPADSWEGVYDATTDKDACIQKAPDIASSPVFGVEDCMYLNVFVPQDAYSPAARPLPVMVYIHGGAYTVGSARLSELDPARIIATRKVVVVTLQYRLGVFGFFSTGDSSASGNYGLKDQVMALRWVQDNIRAFGGDPRRVTIFGHRAGSASTQFHMLSPLSRGLFHRVISMSGSALAKWSAPNPDSLSVARTHGRILGIADADSISTIELVEKFRGIDADILTNSIDRLKVWDIHLNAPYRPAVEPQDEPDAFLTEAPNTAWSHGKYASVDWLTGSIPADSSVFTQTIYRNESLIEDLNLRFSEILDLLLLTDISSKQLKSLRRRFLKTTPPDKWITPTNYDEVTTMLSEAGFLYPMIKSVKEHIQNRNQARSTSVYSFQFQGRYSFSQLFTDTNQSYELTHSDQLIYLFRIPELFPEFPPGSPEAEMCQLWVKFLVDFATKTNIKKEGTCTALQCNVVTFGNTNNIYFPVNKTLVPGLDEDLYRFWKKFYGE
ncbi:juvenile hormone esterase-like [Anopheles ziemanni]|uniref:juvenile hormone esterase-like n=1 Tax=Anopheles coustani TaxID=139045 RepID=UPI002659A8DE|nr:juvenile hormone esterase-like [Anopheles coustani]XP_058178710.1 juvenile hormone esterase-like [Anopheles ziemanni]